MILVRINVNRDPQTRMERNNKFIQIVWFDMKHITFILILKPASNVAGKMQMGEGEPKGRRLVQMLFDEGRGTLHSYRPCMADENEVNAAGKLDTRYESKERAFDHHDTLDT